MSIRVVQWTTGGVARSAVRAVLAHPRLELVGCFAWSAEKDGKDVGELCGLPPLGVQATSSFDTIIALRPDVVLYMPLLWDVDDMVRLLEAGINVISTANFLTGRSYGEKDMNRLHEAARRGGVSLYGTGINPGLAGVVGLTAAALCREVEKISIFEAADCTHYASAETWQALGFGSPPDTPGLADAAKQRQLVFQDAVEVIAKALGADLDEVRYAPEFGLATRDLDLGYMTIPRGTVCGLKGRWQGIVRGRPLIELGLLWRLGNAMEPDWPIEEGYVMEIRGHPNVRLRYEFEYSADAVDRDAHTANPAVNAVPAVVAAPPGLVTADDLPLVTAGSIAAP
ncbi:MULTISPECIES: dihydrodipicolinate reductase [unclassified Parafrankia]|uniref:NAD(P)H-dependent amine dehydrogenase family protein n=1 Tax=unclassified Parafrankia TaxID=2994368 RepID=UPI000DA47E4A|nr:MULTISPECIES: dihydrodipicolinate reductase [unclassified Parafrankia]TCJ31983.1 dihydrodipicolinate reductase [Parafrankia sp. BMG5.11]SQD96840.1 Dihydrodipicolinate reductase [Parafrankia sp. Ea1.12]